MKLKIQEPTTNSVVNLALDTIKINKQALVFVNTKRSAEKCAEDIAKKIKTKDPKYEQLSNQLSKALSKPTKQCQRLSKIAKKGIAFHHAGLVQKQRSLIEDELYSGEFL